VPRRFYTKMLPGIPTIRPFEALACGIPLLSAPWQDSENLFRVGEDFLMVTSGAEMAEQMKRLRLEPELRRSLAQKGLETIRARHTCGHRADELLAIVTDLRPSRAKSRDVAERVSTSLDTNGDSRLKEVA
jgi:spore maturation protein CgeB